MSELFSDAVASGVFWQIAGATIIAVAGSSAVSALITSAADSRTASKDFRRIVRKDALHAIASAYSTYLRYGNLAEPSEYDDERDQILAESSAKMHAAVAAIGDAALLPVSQQLALLGERFAGQNEDTGIGVVDGLFSDLINRIAEQVPAK